MRLLLTVASVTVLLVGCATAPVTPNALTPEEQLRQVLLLSTPIGTGQQALTRRLERDGLRVISPRDNVFVYDREKNRIYGMLLGQDPKNPDEVFCVAVSYLLDEDRKLMDIKISRDPHVGPWAKQLMEVLEQTPSEVPAKAGP